MATDKPKTTATATKTPASHKPDAVAGTGKSSRLSNSGPHIFVRQVRSGTRSRGTHKKTLEAMGLGRIGKTNTLPDNQAVRGMVRSVIQWLEVKHV